MSNMEKCVSLLNEFSEAQLGNIAAFLEAARETAEDSFCQRMYKEYQAAADKGDTISLDSFAQSLGISI